MRPPVILKPPVILSVAEESKLDKLDNLINLKLKKLMSNQNQTSNLVVTEEGIIPGLERFSEKKQKAIIVSEVACTCNEIIKNLDAAESARLRIKEINSFLRRTKEFKEITNIKFLMKDLKKKNQLLAQERVGMLRLAKKLGFDVESEIKNIRRIENK